MGLRPWAVLRLVALVVLVSAVLPADPVGSQDGVPGKPQQLRIYKITGGLRADWVRPETGGSEITGYDVQIRETGAEEWSDWPHTGINTQARISPLGSSTRYFIRVRAVNANGAGPWATTEPYKYRPGVAAGLPAAPDMPTATVAGGEMTVSWDAVTDDGGAPILAYQVRYSLDRGRNYVIWRPDGISDVITGTSTVIGGVQGDPADFRVVVYARNEVGWSRASPIGCPPEHTSPQRRDPPPNPPPPNPPPPDPPPPDPPPPVTTTTTTTTTTTPVVSVTTTTAPDPPPVQPLPPPQPPTGDSPPQSPPDPPPPPPPPLESLPPRQPVSTEDPPPQVAVDPPPPLEPLPPPQSPADRPPQSTPDQPPQSSESPRRPSSQPPQAPPRDMPAG